MFSKTAARHVAALCGAVAIGVAGLLTVQSLPAAFAGPDGGVCARLNGAPFYIPAQGYMPQPGEVITGPVHAGPCEQTAPSTDSARPELPQPNLPSTTTSTTTTSPPPPPPAP